MKVWLTHQCLISCVTHGFSHECQLCHLVYSPLLLPLVI